MMYEVFAEDTFYEWLCDVKGDEVIQFMEETGYLDTMELHVNKYEKLRVGIMQGERYNSIAVDPASWCINGGWFKDVADMLSTSALLSSDHIAAFFHPSNFTLTHTVYHNFDGSFTVYGRG